MISKSANVTTKKRSQLLPPRDFTGETYAAGGDALSFLATNETGSESKIFDLEPLPGTRLLKRELLAGMMQLNGPRGPRRSVYSVQASYNAVSLFLRWLDEQGHQVRSLSDVNVALWNKWLLRNSGGRTTSGYAAVVNLRAVLRSTQLATPDLVAAMNRRITKDEQRSQESYSEEEFRRIRRLARKSIHTAARRISANYQLLLQLQSGVPVDAKLQPRAEALLELFETGDVSSQAAYTALGACDSMGRGSLRPLRSALLLTPREGWAAAVLLAAEAGWNRSVIERMPLPDNSVGAGEATPIYSVTVYKPRQGPNRQHSTSTEPATDGAGRALSWLISATEPARAALARFDAPADRLLIYGRWNGPSVTHLQLGFGIPQMRDAEQATAPKQPTPSQLVGVSLRKLRRTRQVVFDRSPAQNSRSVHEETYVRNDSATREQVRPVIEEGISNALLHASATVVLSLVWESDAGEDICSGKLDTAIAACRDYAHHPETGQPCKDSFLACLGCTNAVATPRHLVRIVALHDALQELSGCLEQTDWAERWEVHFCRLCMLLDRHTSEAERVQARQSVTESDRAVVARLLAGGYSAA